MPSTETHICPVPDSWGNYFSQQVQNYKPQGQIKTYKRKPHTAPSVPPAPPTAPWPPFGRPNSWDCINHRNRPNCCDSHWGFFPIIPDFIPPCNVDTTQCHCDCTEEHKEQPSEDELKKFDHEDVLVVDEDADNESEIEDDITIK